MGLQNKVGWCCVLLCGLVQIRVWFGILNGFCFLSSGMVLVCFHMMCFVSASYRCNIILKAWFYVIMYQIVWLCMVHCILLCDMVWFGPRFGPAL